MPPPPLGAAPSGALRGPAGAWRCRLLPAGGGGHRPRSRARGRAPTRVGPAFRALDVDVDEPCTGALLLPVTGTRGQDGGDRGLPAISLCYYTVRLASGALRLTLALDCSGSAMVPQ
jgi:hypothetical protein